MNRFSPAARRGDAQPPQGMRKRGEPVRVIAHLMGARVYAAGNFALIAASRRKPACAASPSRLAISCAGSVFVAPKGNAGMRLAATRLSRTRIRTSLSSRFRSPALLHQRVKESPVYPPAGLAKAIRPSPVSPNAKTALPAVWPPPGASCRNPYSATGGRSFTCGAHRTERPAAVGGV